MVVINSFFKFMLHTLCQPDPSPYVLVSFAIFTMHCASPLVCCAYLTSLFTLILFTPRFVWCPDVTLIWLAADLLLRSLDGEKSSISTQARLTFRTRSLDDSASVLVESSELEGGKQKTGRNRAGTIRASEYQQQRTSVVANTNSRALPTELSLSRRTRSGTITGPRASVLPTTTSQKYNIAPAFRKHISSSSKSPESDDELLLKAPGWVDEDLEYLGLPNHARTLTAQTDEEPDELMLTGQWRDVHEGWPAQT